MLSTIVTKMGRVFVLLCFIFILIVAPVWSKPQLLTPIKRSFEVPCKLDSDCCRNAFCDRSNLQTGGFCSCLDHYILQTNNTDMDCLPTPAQFGDPCEKNIQCQVSFGNMAECAEGSCKCNNQAHFENGLCYKSGKIGDRCNTNTDCYIEDTLTFCVRSVCVCNTFYHPVDNGQRCVKSKILGDTCVRDEECTVDNSRCHDECRCNMHYVSSLNKTMCLEAADHFNATCIEDGQCSQFLQNGACVNGACGCAKDYHFIDNKCWENVDLYGDCEDDKECILTDDMTNLMKCVSEKCSCIHGVHPNRTCVVQPSDEKNSSPQLSIQSFYLLTASILVFKGLF